MKHGTTNDPRVNKRVELSPACDLWMRGARFGNVARVVKRGATPDTDILCVRMGHPQVRKLVRVLANTVTFR